MPTAMPDDAIGEQVGEIGGQHRRLLLAPVVIGAEIDGVLVDAVEQTRGDRGQPRLGVAVGGGVIAVDIAEIALAVDQRIADGEVLREPRQRIVDRLIAVGMEVAHGVADDLGAFAELALGAEPELLHGVEQPPVHGLEPVAHVGERAVHDGRERVGEVALLERLAQVHRLDRPKRIRWRCDASSHGSRLAHRPVPLKGSLKPRAAFESVAGRLTIGYKQGSHALCPYPSSRASIVSKRHTYILGINAYDHDVSACLLRDGEIAFAIAKERINRHKHDDRVLPGGDRLLPAGRGHHAR